VVATPDSFHDPTTQVIAAANTPHTITNVLMICFSSEDRHR
jgi:hypothetical protein